MTNFTNTVLYIGVTGDLWSRVYEHKNKINPFSFTANYNINKLVYYEEFNSIHDAIDREKQLKGGSRQKKIDLVTRENSHFEDLAEEWYKL